MSSAEVLNSMDLPKPYAVLLEMVTFITKKSPTVYNLDSAVFVH